MGVAAGSVAAGWFAATAFTADSTSHQPVHEDATEHEQLLSLRKAVETMQLGVTITDLDGKIRYSNPAEAKQHLRDGDPSVEVHYLGLTDGHLELTAWVLDPGEAEIVGRRVREVLEGASISRR